MPTRPAVVGLLRHYLYLTNVYPDSDVTVLWTFAEGAPSAARIAYERGAIIAWLSSHWRQITIPEVSASRLTTWSMETAPPIKVATAAVWPNIPGTNSGGGGSGARAPRSLAVVVALRSQPVGSATRDRLNGRIFHGGLTTSSGQALRTAGDQILNPAPIVTAYHNLRDRLTPVADANSGTWVIPSWRAGNAPRVPPLMVPVNHVLARTQIAHQRRRMPRQGPYARGA